MKKFEKLNRAEMKNVKGGYENPNCWIYCYSDTYLGRIGSVSCPPDPLVQCQAVNLYAAQGVSRATCTCTPPQ